MSAGMSVVHNRKNKYIDLFSKVFSNLKVLYIFPLISIFINYITYTISDSKVSIFFLFLFNFISYILMVIKEDAVDVINDNIKKIKDISKNNSVKIIIFLNKMIWLDKLILFGELLMILRCILILFEIN